VKLAKVFGKSEDREPRHLQTIESVPVAFAREAFFRYLFPKNTEKDLTVPQRLVIDVTLQSLQKAEARQKAVPRLPQVIPRLLQSLRDPDSSTADYVAIINKDPVMAAAVFKLANSVYFNPVGRRIQELEEAIVKLGINGLRSVLSAAVMQPILQKESAYFSRTGQRIWQHSLCCAVCCEHIAAKYNIERFKVYLLGLMHDIGSITVFSELSRQFKINKEEVEPGHNAFVPSMKKLATILSYSIAKDWDLPKEICQALLDQVQAKKEAEMSEFGYILYHANLVAETYAAIYPKNPARALALLQELGLPDKLYQTLDQLSREL